ncbi:hypothetical protein KIW84_033766 [Lathyrus oleraceus]|uniref:Uncharacterized protein n=1 Tax=Pisum sativum TaxID=3888 RepID=A0A9D4Y291_PEA|nr:hypothetical protein KIW84_033766 [Pisum sativum]
MNCRDDAMSNVLVDTRSSLNVFPKSTLSKLSYQGPPMRQNGVVVKAFDGSHKTVIGEVDLPIKIGPSDFQITFQDGQIPSRSLMSLSMLRGVHINCLYGYPVTDNVGSAIKHSTLHLGSIVVSGRRVVYTIITIRITYDTLHNFLYSILIAGQSGINITPNIHTYV